MSTISFVINTHDEPAEQISALSDALAKFYPGAPITIAPDGKGGRPRLKTRAHAGRWISRYLDWGLAPNTDWLVKIDPDAQVLRAITEPFKGDVQCAKKTYVLKGREYFYPQTGVIAFSGAAARAIREQALSPRYQNFPGTRDDYQEEIIIRDICQQLGLKITDRPDFMIGLRRNRDGVDNPSFSHR